jgi:hypothetical protein
MTKNNSRYLADPPYLRNAFEAEAPLLAFETSDLEDIKLLIKNMGCEGRKLSDLAKEKPASKYGRSLVGVTPALSKRNGGTLLGVISTV